MKFHSEDKFDEQSKTVIADHYYSQDQYPDLTGVEIKGYHIQVEKKGKEALSKGAGD